MTMTTDPTLYLELLKKTLTFTVYDETHIPVHLAWSRRGGIKKGIAALLKKVAGSTGWHIVQPANYTKEKIEKGGIWPEFAHSMIGVKRMGNLQYCVETALKENIPGNFIETGVWRGGSCIFMRGILKAYGVTDRIVYVADSFEGLPKPNGEVYAVDAGDTHFKVDFLAVSVDQVKDAFRKYDLLDDQVVFLKGWFKDTLPAVSKEKFAVIRLDGDMYESTMDGLGNLYNALSPGGFCIIDDYALEGCRLAVEDYRKKHGVTEEIIDIDGMGVYWRKAK